MTGHTAGNLPPEVQDVIQDTVKVYLAAPLLLEALKELLLKWDTAHEDPVFGDSDWNAARSAIAAATRSEK